MNEPRKLCEFGELLEEYRKQARTPLTRGGWLTIEKLLDLLEPEIAWRPSKATYGHWKTGKHPISVNDRRTLVGLVKVLFQCGGIISLEQANALLRAGDYRDLDEAERISISLSWADPTASTSSQSLPDGVTVPSLPPPLYKKFIGRIESQEEILQVLQGQERILAVTGLGGIGKTALARAIADLAQQQEMFERIVWMTAKTEQFNVSQIQLDQDTRWRFGMLEDVLNQIGRQCGRVEIFRLPLKEKRKAVATLSQEKRILIVLDNLDTVTESGRLVQDLSQILGRSNLMLTSRYEVKQWQVYPYKIIGLPKNDSIAFLRAEWEDRRQPQSALSDADLEKIWQKTGGAPLAMKLVIPQIARTKLDHVLTMLERASIKEDDYAFYEFIYWHAWELLDENERFTLVDLSVLPPGIGGTTDELEQMTDLPLSQLWQAVDQLVVLSLVDKTYQANKPLFSLHHLTHYFVKSDIIGSWH